jgi:hypothetical protein
VKRKFEGVAGLELLNGMARQLCRDAGVDLSHGGRYEHIEQFQNYLTERYFTGDMAFGRPRLNWSLFTLATSGIFAFFLARQPQGVLLDRFPPFKPCANEFSLPFSYTKTLARP